MKSSLVLIRRNIKLYFKDRGTFLTSLITPAVLLVLYATFLANVYRDSFSSYIPGVPENIINALVCGQLISSLLAVSCITVAFCSNFISVQDRVRGTANDFFASPISPKVLSVSYFVAAFVSTMIVAFTALALCIVYCRISGYALSIADIFFLAIDAVISVFFGTALSSAINTKLSSQGQISAVGTIVSSGYGFICGAYMPISSFSDGMQKAISFLPSTYTTSLFRNHALRGALNELESSAIFRESVEELRNTLDCNIYFFGHRVATPTMYAVVIAGALAALLVFILINTLEIRRSPSAR